MGYRLLHKEMSLKLTEEDRAQLAGERGEANLLAMSVINTNPRVLRSSLINLPRRNETPSPV